MNIVDTVLGTPLGYLMFFCHQLIKNYGVAIILFTLFSKIILFPLSISVQKNSIRMVKLQPKMDEIKLRYAGDKDRIADEQIKLYDDEKYSPAMGCLPTLIQIPLILGLINVIYNPLQHLLHISKDTIALLSAKAAELLGVAELGAGAQLQIIDAIHNPIYTDAFMSLQNSIPDLTHILEQILDMDVSFSGFNLGMTPSFLHWTSLSWIPVISGVTCLLMCLIQNRINVLQREQSAANKWGMTIFLVAFSTYFPFIVPAGVGLYWIASNVFSIIVMFLVNLIINPKKYIDYSNRPPKATLSPAEKAELRKKKSANRAREKADNKRFYASENENKQLVFYSAKSGFYKYFASVIEYILDNSDIVIHYVTSDPNDAIFGMEKPQIIPYYIGEKALIPFMMKMEADMVVMTMPDLQKYHIKRSLVRKDIEYVYIFHTVASMHMTLREGAVDHYDTIFCVGPHQIREIRRTEEIYELPEKKLIECGYGLIDDLMKAYDQMPPKEGTIPQILIAPSWQADNILESCIDELLTCVVGKGYRVIVRPHPEFVKRFKARMDAIVERWGGKQDENFIIELNFSSNETIYQSDILVTDWSNIAFEFSYCTKKPTIFINTPMKVMNPEYEVLGIEPLDISLRDKIGVTIDLSDVDTFGTIVQETLESADGYQDKIDHVVSQYLYHPGHCGEVGGAYIIEALNEKARLRDQFDEEE